MHFSDAVFCNTKIVFLATKPQYVTEVVSKLYTNTLGLPLNILISIMAGIPLIALQQVRCWKINVHYHIYYSLKYN